MFQVKVMRLTDGLTGDGWLQDLPDNVPLLLSLTQKLHFHNLKKKQKNQVDKISISRKCFQFNKYRIIIMRYLYV